MTIQECYAALGGDYQEVLGRLCSEALVRRFVGKFLSDQSFQLLDTALSAGNYEEAFRAAHTLKGVTQNLSFTKLYQSATKLQRRCAPKITIWPCSCCPKWRRTTPKPPPRFTPIRAAEPVLHRAIRLDGPFCGGIPLP